MGAVLRYVPGEAPIREQLKIFPGARELSGFRNGLDSRYRFQPIVVYKRLSGLGDRRWELAGFYFGLEA